VQFAGTAQGLSWTQGGGVFLGVVDQEHRQLKLALELTQVAEQGSDLRGLVLVALMQTNERIQNQEQGPEGLDGQAESLAIGGRI
jgi:hypothetical protein